MPILKPSGGAPFALAKMRCWVDDPATDRSSLIGKPTPADHGPIKVPNLSDLEDIVNQIDDGSLEADQATELLKKSLA